MTENASELKRRLNTFGLSDAAIEAAWPRWWSEEAEDSTSARAELRFGVARRLGMDPASLLEERNEPRFLFPSQARFKNLAGESELEREGISSFGRAVAKMLLAATPPRATIAEAGLSAGDLREELLRLGQFRNVGLGDLLALCWGTGIPVAYLRVFPWDQKRMAAMTVRIADRWAILLARDSRYPAPIAFWLAHELGHVILRHISGEGVIVDLGNEAAPEPSDPEEASADAFALELLTGEERPVVLRDPSGAPPSAAGLAKAAVERSAALGIEPGTLALCYGFSTKEWAIANGALGVLYPQVEPIAGQINELAIDRLDTTRLPADSLAFLDAVLDPDPETRETE
jgi:hypothetical protein